MFYNIGINFFEYCQLYCSDNKSQSSQILEYIISATKETIGVNIGPNWRTSDLKGSIHPEWEKKHLQVMGLEALFQEEIQADSNSYSNGLFEYERENYELAYKYFLAAHENELIKSPAFRDGNAALKLGEMYMRGLGVKQNFQKGYQYYFYAAKKQNSLAQIGLGIIYEESLGVPKNLTIALMWYMVAYLQDECNIKATDEELSLIHI